MERSTVLFDYYLEMYNFIASSARKMFANCNLNMTLLLYWMCLLWLLWCFLVIGNIGHWLAIFRNLTLNIKHFLFGFSIKTSIFRLIFAVWLFFCLLNCFQSIFSHFLCLFKFLLEIVWFSSCIFRCFRQCGNNYIY